MRKISFAVSAIFLFRAATYAHCLNKVCKAIVDDTPAIERNASSDGHDRLWRNQPANPHDAGLLYFGEARFTCGAFNKLGLQRRPCTAQSLPV
ncbi:hypothetical protein [Nitrobacter sp.]|uniref:hypothetical protein n=1 Tax=Nitrobacter sp. TaxID=29420 RepID=UPI003F64C770